MADDSFAVIWRAIPGDSSDFSAARFFTAEATPPTPQFPLEDSTESGNWEENSLEHVPGGRIVALWSSTASVGDDVDGFSIQARRFKNPHIFADGFESGDTSAWSNTVP